MYFASACFVGSIRIVSLVESRRTNWNGCGHINDVLKVRSKKAVKLMNQFYETVLRSEFVIESRRTHSNRFRAKQPWT
jgi:hypothetical protein